MLVQHGTAKTSPNETIWLEGFGDWSPTLSAKMPARRGQAAAGGSQHNIATGDEQIVACHEVGIGRCQKQHGIGDIVNRGHAPQSGVRDTIIWRMRSGTLEVRSVSTMVGDTILTVTPAGPSSCARFLLIAQKS